MYHEVQQPYGLLWNLRPALKPNAHVGVIDTRKQTAAHGTPPDLLRCPCRDSTVIKVRLNIGRL